MGKWLRRATAAKRAFRRRKRAARGRSGKRRSRATSRPTGAFRTKVRKVLDSLIPVNRRTSTIAPNGTLGLVPINVARGWDQITDTDVFEPLQINVPSTASSPYEHIQNLKFRVTKLRLQLRHQLAKGGSNLLLSSMPAKYRIVVLGAQTRLAEFKTNPPFTRGTVDVDGWQANDTFAFPAADYAYNSTYHPDNKWRVILDQKRVFNPHDYNGGTNSFLPNATDDPYWIINEVVNVPLPKGGWKCQLDSNFVTSTGNFITASANQFASGYMCVLIIHEAGSRTAYDNAWQCFAAIDVWYR